jgi:RHS repeat-associated protein
MQYDDLYRVTRVDYSYSAGDDVSVDPFYAEDQGIDPDPRRAQPAPHTAFSNRVLWQSFAYDWLGNTTATGDDAAGFYDRSLGTVTNGTAAQGPYQLKSASGANGSLLTQYDDAGNLTSLVVTRTGACLPAGAICAQVYGYDWDEVGRLVAARRWDTAGTPTGSPAVSLAYAYDANDQRVLKTATDPQANSAYTVYAFSSLELRRASFDGTDYALSTANEVPYLAGHGVRLARVHYEEDDVPSLASGKVHVLLELADHLGSVNTIIDHDTSEVIEKGSYLAYGAAESDYRPTRWASFREDYRFTGKEEDSEVALQYFGRRSYSPALGRWTSADPLAVHGLGADFNAYAYVRGAILRAVDIIGLDPTNVPVQAPAPESPPVELPGPPAPPMADPNPFAWRIWMPPNVAPTPVATPGPSGGPAAAVFPSITVGGIGASLIVVGIALICMTTPAPPPLRPVRLPNASVQPRTPQRSSVPGDDILDRIGAYGSSVPVAPGEQKNHLNQDAAYRGVIPSGVGLIIPLQGDAIQDVGSPHYEFHAALEEFWNQFRAGGRRAGERPTNEEYGDALVNALHRAGLTPQEATAAAGEAQKQREDYGLQQQDPVPSVPGRMNQKRPESTTPPSPQE